MTPRRPPGAIKEPSIEEAIALINSARQQGVSEITIGVRVITDRLRERRVLNPGENRTPAIENALSSDDLQRRADVRLVSKMGPDFTYRINYS